MVSAFHDEDGVIPVKIIVLSYKYDVLTKIHFAMVLSPIEIEKTSKVVTGDSKMVDLKPARLEVYNVKLADFLGEIKENDKLIGKNGYYAISDSIPKQFAKKDKKSFSVDVDSEGNELSEGQQDYFKNAKTVDGDGRLKVYYHGTQSVGFTVFDIKKAKSSGTYEKGFYFSESDSHAGQYGDRYKVYLTMMI